MMKWGRKKPTSSSSSSRLSSISHVFPISWLSKFKQMSGNSQAKPTKVKRKGKWSSESVISTMPGSCKDGRFYGGDDDAFWKLSFGEECVDGRKSGGGLKSVWYDSDDGLEIPPSSCGSCTPTATKVVGRGESQKFSNMVSEIRKMRELHGNIEVSPQIDRCKGEKESKETEFKILRREVVKEPKLRKTNRRILEEKWLDLERESDKAEEISRKSVGKDRVDLEPIQTIRTTKRDDDKLIASGLKKYRYVSSMNSRNSNLKPIEEECVLAALNFEETDGVSAEELNSEWQKLKKEKIKELMSNCEKQRKSLHISKESHKRRTKQSSKVRVYSPRTPSKVEVCKIKALEDMKKAKMKMKKKTKEKTAEERTALDGFAVVKCSFDPQRDFRDSMVEMIMEKRIRRPEELEELLACYLTLNSDEYHDLIIKVFQKVWFDLNQAYFAPELQDENCSYDLPSVL